MPVTAPDWCKCLPCRQGTGWITLLMMLQPSVARSPGEHNWSSCPGGKHGVPLFPVNQKNISLSASSRIWTSVVWLPVMLQEQQFETKQ